MNICVFGLWHLGSVYSACLAKLGHQVTGLDYDKEVVGNLKKGNAPLFEPGLNELIADNIQAKRLSFTSDAQKALKTAQAVWVAFDTPVDEKDRADTLFVEKNIKTIMPFLNDGAKVVISSQAPVGFVGKIEEFFSKNYPEKKCYFVCSPENLRLGNALDVFLNPDRIIIGIRNQKDKEVFIPLFTSISTRLEWMKTESAEMTKHAINSFLATEVCFANEIATICEHAGADAKEVERGLKTESRIGPKAYLGPGVAFSGGTLARDINFLRNLSRKYQVPSYLLNAVDESNSYHKGWVIRKCSWLLGDLGGKTIAILGLTYKPGTDTLRRSFAVDLAKALTKQGALIKGFDPVIKSVPSVLSRVISLKRNIKEAVTGADAIIIATEWPEFREMNQDTKNLLKNKIVIDPNGFIAKQVEHEDIKYYSVGRSAIRKHKE